MKKSDVLKTFRKVNEATTDGYLPSENTHLVNKQYVDDIATNKADDLEVAKALNKSSTIFTKDFEVVTAKISDIITYTRIIDNPDDATYKMVAFYCNLDKILDNTNKLDCYFVQIKYKYNGEYKIATCSSGIIYTSYMKLNMDNTITMSGTSNIANLEFSMEPNKIYQEDYSTIDSTTQCSIFIACGMCYINENNIDIIKDAEISVFLRRKNFLSLNNTGEYTPTGDYNPSTKKYVDDKVASLIDSAPETLDTLKELSTALGDDPNFATTMTTTLGNKVDKVDGKTLSTNDLTGELKANYDAAYTHSQAAHAPSDAQKNSNITKSEIEAKLTGNITTHTHSQYAPIDSPYFNTSISMGRRSGTVGENSVAIGYEVYASGDYSHAEGYNTTASGDNSHAEGCQTSASETASHVEGMNTTAAGTASHAEGMNTTAAGTSSHAEGYKTRAGVSYSHAEGNETTASGSQSHAEGYQTVASGHSSHAEGETTKAQAQYSHAEGYQTTIESSGIAAHAEGYQTKASGSGSHAEGASTQATHMYAHAEGFYSIASGICSHAEGNHTIASAYNAQHVQGSYNIEDRKGKYIHIVGNGTSDTNRSNAHTLDSYGNAWYQGTVSVDTDPIDDMDLATKKYVDCVKDSIPIKDQVSGYIYALQICDGILTTKLLGNELEITIQPNKLSYTEGEYFDPTGMQLSILYPDGTTSIVEDTDNIIYNQNALKPGDSELEINYKYILAGITLSSIINITITPFDPEVVLVDFEYTTNDDGTYTITGWKGTLNGVASTEMIIPNNSLINI